LYREHPLVERGCLIAEHDAGKVEVLLRGLHRAMAAVAITAIGLAPVAAIFVSAA